MPQDDFVVVEQGAHNGQLACDILAHLNEKIEYRIIEPNEKIPVPTGYDGRPNRVRSTTQPCCLRSGSKGRTRHLSLQRVAGCLSRASPRFIKTACGKNNASPPRDGKFFWQEEPLPDELATFTYEIGTVPDGYITEVCPAMRIWIHECSEMFSEQGRWWIIDYGHESPDYFSPLRKEGTLQCFHQHQAHDDPFSNIGETDITAHVNLTHLIQWAGEAGLQLEATDRSTSFPDSRRKTLAA